VCTVKKTPDDGQRNCPKHVEFHSKNKFEKSVNLVGFIIRNLSRCMVTWTSNTTHPLTQTRLNKESVTKSLTQFHFTYVCGASNGKGLTEEYPPMFRITQGMYNLIPRGHIV